jgi:hypothetical protein
LKLKRYLVSSDLEEAIVQATIPDLVYKLLLCSSIVLVEAWIWSELGLV